MKEINVYSMGALPAFLRTNDEPTYWSERLNYEISQMLYAASVQGLMISRAEATDFDTYEGLVDTWLADFKTWVDRAYDRSNSRLLQQDFSELVPSIITTGGTVAAAALSGGSSLLIPLLVNAGLQIVAHIVAGQANNLLSGESENIGDIAEAIREAFLRSRNTDESLSLFVSETGEGPDLVRIPISEVLFKALLSDNGDNITSLLQQAIANFAVRVYEDDGRRWLEFGLANDDALVG